MGASMDRGRAESEGRRHLLTLVRQALGTQPTEAAPARRLSDIGEECFVRGLMRHRVAALLHPALEDGRLQGWRLPVDAPGLCRQAYFGVLRRNVVALELGEALLQRTDEAGLRAMPRGPWAWLRGHRPLYADPGVRPVDRLVVNASREDHPMLRDLARSFGFDRVRSDGALVRHIGRVELLLDLDAAPPPRKQAAPFVDAVSALAALRFRRWLGLVDVHCFVASGAPLGVALAEADVRGLARPARAALRLARDLLSTPVPEEALGLAHPEHRPGSAHRVTSLAHAARENP